MNPIANQAAIATTGQIARSPRMVELGRGQLLPDSAQGLGVKTPPPAMSSMAPAAACDKLYQDSQILEQLVDQLQHVSQQFRVNVPLPSLPTQQAEAPQQPTSAAPQPPMSELAHRLEHIHWRLTAIAQAFQATIQSFDL